MFCSFIDLVQGLKYINLEFKQFFRKKSEPVL